MIEGKKVGLAGIERDDLPQLLQWRNNPKMRRYFREFRELTMRSQEKWYEDKVLRDNTTMMFCIRRLKDNKLLGCCGLAYINWTLLRHAEISLYIGWKNSYIDNIGYAEESAKLLLDHAFKDLSLNKVWAEVFTPDKKKKRLFDKIGFKVDGVLRENYFCDGKFWDSYIVSILKSEWLKKR